MTGLKGLAWILLTCCIGPLAYGQRPTAQEMLPVYRCILLTAIK